MGIGFLFWLLMLLWLIFGFFLGAPTVVGGVTVPRWGGHIFLWCLLALLGWGVFGFPIHG